MLGVGCVEPQPQTLTLPRADDQDKKVRQAMVEFNEARFQEECAAIDLAVAMTGLPAETLPGGGTIQQPRPWSPGLLPITTSYVPISYCA